MKKLNRVPKKILSRAVEHAENQSQDEKLARVTLRKIKMLTQSKLDMKVNDSALEGLLTPKTRDAIPMVMAYATEQLVSAFKSQGAVRTNLNDNSLEWNSSRGVVVSIRVINRVVSVSIEMQSKSTASVDSNEETAAPNKVERFLIPKTVKGDTDKAKASEFFVDDDWSNVRAVATFVKKQSISTTLNSIARDLLGNKQYTKFQLMQDLKIMYGTVVSVMETEGLEILNELKKY